MRAFILILTICCLGYTTHAQTDACKTGIDSARKDYANGILRLYLYGLTNSSTYGRLLCNKYGIDVVEEGCIIDEERNCYSTYMYEQIEKRLGAHFFNDVARKAQQLDSMGLGDRMSAFPGGESALMKFIYCNLALTNENCTEKTVRLQFAIDTTGKPIEAKVMNTSNAEVSKEVMRLVNLMPDWTPATINGKPIQQQWVLPIRFDPKTKQQYCF